MVTPRFQFAGRCVTGSDPAAPNPRVAPNFSLRELARKDNTFFIHPNLVLTLQNIRNLYGNSIKIIAVDESGGGARGFSATIGAADLAQLEKVCGVFVTDKQIAKLAAQSGGLFFEARKGPADTIAAEEALEIAFYVTTGFETSGDPFQQVTGNFDKAGLSFGPSQVNFGTGTLTPLFQKFREIDLKGLKACFTKSADWDEWCAVCEKKSAEQVLWADKNSEGARKQFMKNPWLGYLQAVGRVPAFRAAMVEHGKKEYGGKLRRALQWLGTVSPIAITDLRCFAALFDLCTQQGSLDKAHDEIRARVARENPKNQKDLVRIACEERAKKANAEWRAISMSRRLALLYGAPVSCTVEGQTAVRDNAYFSLLPEMKVEGVRQFLA